MIFPKLCRKDALCSFQCQWRKQSVRLSGFPIQWHFSPTESQKDWSCFYEWKSFYLCDLHVTGFNYSMKYELISICHLLQDAHTQIAKYWFHITFYCIQQDVMYQDSKWWTQKPDLIHLNRLEDSNPLQHIGLACQTGRSQFQTLNTKKKVLVFCVLTRRFLPQTTCNVRKLCNASFPFHVEACVLLCSSTSIHAAFVKTFSPFLKHK